MNQELEEHLELGGRTFKAPEHGWYQLEQGGPMFLIKDGEPNEIVVRNGRKEFKHYLKIMEPMGDP